MCWFAKFRFCIFMSINKKNKKKRKFVEKIRGVYLYTLPICHLLVIIEYQAGYQIKAYTKYFYPMVRYASNLIWIVLNIFMRNKRKIGGKRRVCTTLPKCQLLTFLDYQTCYQIKVETLHFNPVVWYTNDLIWIFKNINENIKNKRKMLETFNGCTYNITHMSDANYSKLPK